VAKDPDAYAIWGDWDLDQFKVEVARWCSATHPPTAVLEIVEQWCRRLKQPMEWSSAARVSRENDPERNLRWMWVPGADWDESAGRFRVQCYFRTHELETPPRLECVEFLTVPAVHPDGPDRADGMG
jgi:hypothetical protein